LRPILMASFTIVMGVMSLALSSGAGSGGQNAIGTGTIGGMLSATVLAIFFVPLFFVATLRLFRVKPKTLILEGSSNHSSLAVSAWASSSVGKSNTKLRWGLCDQLTFLVFGFGGCFLGLFPVAN